MVKIDSGVESWIVLLPGGEAEWFETLMLAPAMMGRRRWRRAMPAVRTIFQCRRLAAS